MALEELAKPLLLLLLYRLSPAVLEHVWGERIRVSECIIYVRMNAWTVACYV